jgi:hypothetical protein
MRATIKIQMDNAAFSDGNHGAELADILQDLANKVRQGETERRLRDTNGNPVGDFKIIGKPKTEDAR